MKIPAAIILSFFLNNLFSQKLTKISFEQVNNHIHIHYYMSDVKNNDLFNIEIKCSNNGGKDFNIVPISLKGKAGRNINIKNGENTVIWDVLKDRASLSGSKFVFRAEVSLLKNNNLDEVPEYSEREWIDSALDITSYEIEVNPDFNKTPWYHFQQAAKVHFATVMDLAKEL